MVSRTFRRLRESEVDDAFDDAFGRTCIAIPLGAGVMFLLAISIAAGYGASPVRASAIGLALAFGYIYVCIFLISRTRRKSPANLAMGLINELNDGFSRSETLFRFLNVDPATNVVP